ncbi:MAG TPA: hypothetical protein VGB94_10060 [Acidobacteriaceae bacterium]
MSFMGYILVVAGICAFYGLYVAQKNKRNYESSGTISAADIKRLPVHKSRVRRLNSIEFSKLAASDPHSVLFHITADDSQRNTIAGLRSPRGMTLAELEECLPWIPMDEKILLFPVGGPDTLLIGRLEQLNTNRDLLILDDPNHLLHEEDLDLIG